MSRYHPHPQTQYGNNYDLDPYDRRYIQNRHDHRPEVPAPDPEGCMQPRYMYTSDQIDDMQAKRTRPRRGLWGCLEPSVGTSGPSEWTAPYFNSDYNQQSGYGYGQRRPEQYDPQPREHHDLRPREHHDLQPREHHDPHRRRQPQSRVKHYSSQAGTFEYKSWSPDEDDRLVKYIRERRSFPEIAKALGRTSSSVRGHWKTYFEGRDEYRGIVYNPR